MVNAAAAQQTQIPGAEVWPLSVEAYHTLSEAGLIPERTELLYGVVYHKMSKSPLHTLLMLRLLRRLQQAVPSGYQVRPEQPLTCGDSEPEPDLAVVAGSEDNFAQAHPRNAELVIEVCVTSVEFDRSKLHAYAIAGVKECWLVLASQKQIEVHRQPSGGKYGEMTTHGPAGQLTSAVVSGFSLDLHSLFTS